MSHHLDAPEAAQNGQLYIDDLYLFNAEDSTVFIMDVNSTITEPNVLPGFHHEARYEFRIHFDADQQETLTYRVSFDEAEADGRQPLRLHMLSGDDARNDAAAGELLLTGHTGETTANGGFRLWAGRIADSFYIDLSLLNRVNSAIKTRHRGGRVRLEPWRRPQQFRRHDGRKHRACRLTRDA